MVRGPFAFEDRIYERDGGYYCVTFGHFVTEDGFVLLPLGRDDTADRDSEEPLTEPGIAHEV